MRMADLRITALLPLSTALLLGCAGLSRVEEQRHQQGLQSSIRFFEAGNHDRAIAVARDVAGNSKAKPMALLIEAFSHSKLASWDSAFSRLSACSRLAKPGSLESDIGSLFLGHLEYDRKPVPNLPAAAAHFSKVGKRSLLHEEARLGLGWSFVKVQQFPAASRHFQAILDGSAPSVFAAEAGYGACVRREALQVRWSVACVMENDKDS